MLSSQIKSKQTNPSIKKKIMRFPLSPFTPWTRAMSLFHCCLVSQNPFQESQDVHFEV